LGPFIVLCFFCRRFLSKSGKRDALHLARSNPCRTRRPTGFVVFLGGGLFSGISIRVPLTPLSPPSLDNHFFIKAIPQPFLPFLQAVRSSYYPSLIPLPSSCRPPLIFSLFRSWFFSFSLSTPPLSSPNSLPRSHYQE